MAITKTKMRKMSNSEIDKAICLEGTNYDRKRKVTKAMKHRMSQMRKAGKSYAHIGSHFGVTPTTVRYNLEPDFAKKINKERNNYARNWVPTPGYAADRIAYKKSLIEAGIRL